MNIPMTDTSPVPLQPVLAGVAPSGVLTRLIHLKKGNCATATQFLPCRRVAAITSDVSDAATNILNLIG